MTNSADTYYGTLFSNLSYGMGENGGGLTNPPANPTDLNGPPVNPADWANNNNGAYSNALINELAAAAACAAQSGLPVASSSAAAVASSSYTATVLAALAAAAAASYPVQPSQPPNSSRLPPNFVPQTAHAAADYGAMYYGSSPRQQAPNQRYAGPTTRDVYHAPAADSGWSYMPDAAAQWSHHPNTYDPNHIQQIYPDTRPSSNGSESQKPVATTVFYTPPHMRNNNTPSMLPFNTGVAYDQLATDRMMLAQQQTDRIVNGQSPMVDVFGQRNQLMQQQHLMDKFNRLAVVDDSGADSVSASTTHSDVQPVRTQWQNYREQQHPNDLSSGDSRSHLADGGQHAIPTSSGTSADLFNHTDMAQPSPHTSVGSGRSWASIAGQPARGSAAVLVGSTTGWSAKRVLGQVSQTAPTQQQQRTIQSSCKPPVSSSRPSSNGIGRRSVSSSVEDNYRPPTVDNPTTTGNKSLNTNTANYDDAMQRESEALYQRLAKSINPSSFDTNIEKARFFVIKSFSEDDIHRSIKYAVWCSTELGNKKLDAAFVNANSQYPIYLFYSVNGSGHFCGVAEMTSAVDYDTRVRVWAQDKWQGAFSVRWIFVKDVPNTVLRHIRVETNENKPVTHSRDTTELPLERGRQVIQVFANYSHKLSIFDDFMFYEQRERQDGCRRKDIGNRRS